MHKRLLGSISIGALALTACFEDPVSSTSDSVSESGEDEMGDGDGDATDTEGDGDGDATEGDGDGDPTDSDTEGDGDGDEPLPECGDGEINGEEICDDGPNPPLAEGACKPDCSGIIETRTILKGQSLGGGDLDPNPVASVDSACEVGYKAMFADGVARRATTTPWETVDPIDWPIEPYTRYINESGNEVWITDEVALLGVRDGAHIDTTNPMGISQSCQGMLCSNFRMISGLKEDGTALNADNCNGWSDDASQLSASYGSFANGSYALGTTGCDLSWMFLPTFYQPLCIEQ